MHDNREDEVLTPFVPTTLYTTADKKVEEEARKEVAVPDPSPEEAAAAIKRSEEKDET
jgi:hypothetical protein